MNVIEQAEKALTKAGQVISWQCFGDCRAFSSDPIPEPAEAVEEIKSALSALSAPAQMTDAEIHSLALKHLRGRGTGDILAFARAILSAAPAKPQEQPVAAQQGECFCDKSAPYSCTPCWNGMQAPQQEAGQARELPPLPHTTYNGYADGSEPLYTAEQMQEYARAAQSSPAVQDGQEALRKLCDQLDGMKRTMFLRPGTGQHYSYLVHEDVQAYVEEARKALASAPAQPTYTPEQMAATFRAGMNTARMEDAAPAQPTVPEDVAKDAARYRALFTLEDWCRNPFWPLVDYFRDNREGVGKEDVDAAIDAAIASSDERTRK